MHPEMRHKPYILSFTGCKWCKGFFHIIKHLRPYSEIKIWISVCLVPQYCNYANINNKNAGSYGIYKGNAYPVFYLKKLVHLLTAYTIEAARKSDTPRIKLISLQYIADINP